MYSMNKIVPALAFMILSAGCGQSDPVTEVVDPADSDLGGGATPGGVGSVVQLSIVFRDKNGQVISQGGIATGIVAGPRTIIANAHSLRHKDATQIEVEVHAGDSVLESANPIKLSFPAKSIKSSVDCGGGSDGYAGSTGGSLDGGLFKSDVAVISTEYDLGLPIAELNLSKSKSSALMDAEGLTVVSYGPTQKWSTLGAAKHDSVRRTLPVTGVAHYKDASVFEISSEAGTFCRGDSGGALMHEGKVFGILFAIPNGVTLDANGCASSALLIDLAGAPSTALKKFLPSKTNPSPPCPEPITCPSGTHLNPITETCVPDPWKTDGVLTGCVTKPNGEPLPDRCICYDRTQSDKYGEVQLSCTPAFKTLTEYPWYEDLPYSWCSCSQWVYTTNGGKIGFRPESWANGGAPEWKQFDHGTLVYPNTCYDPMTVCGPEIVPIPDEFRVAWGAPVP